MAKIRTGNQALEDDSAHAFRGAFPRSEFVMRFPSHDYGIDVEVEIFQKGASSKLTTTGLTFKVQLKSTNSWKGYLGIEKEHIEYWLKLDVPVLIVFYDATNDELHACWAHSLSEAYKTGTSSKVKVFPDSSIAVASPDWQKTLVEELRLLRDLKRGQHSSVIPIQTVVTGNVAQTRAFNHALSVFLTKTKATNYRLRKVTGDEVPVVTLTISQDLIEWRLPLGVGGVETRLTDVFTPSTPISSLSDFLLLHSALTFAEANKDIARDWMLQVSPDSFWWVSPGASVVLAPLFQPHHVNFLLRVHANTVSSSSELALGYILALKDLVRYADAEDFEEYAQAIRQEIAAGNDAGSLATNLGNLYCFRGEALKGINLLKEAIELHPPLAQFHGVMFGLALSYNAAGRLNDAVAAYRQSIALGCDAQMIEPLLASSLTFLGRYAEAKAIMDKWSPRGLEDSGWILSKIILDQLVNKLQLSQQVRCICAVTPCPNTTVARVPGQKVTMTESQIYSDLKKHDALDPILWAGIASGTWSDHDPSAIIIASLLDPQNPSLWVHALDKLFVVSSDDDLVKTVVAHARRIFGGEEYEWFIALLQAKPNGPRKDAMFALITDVYHGE